MCDLALNSRITPLYDGAPILDLGVFADSRFRGHVTLDLGVFAVARIRGQDLVVVRSLDISH